MAGIPCRQSPSLCGVSVIPTFSQLSFLKHQTTQNSGLVNANASIKYVRCLGNSKPKTHNYITIKNQQNQIQNPILHLGPRIQATTSVPRSLGLAEASLALDDNRPLADFPLSPWGDYFLNYVPDDEVTQSNKEEQVKEVEKEVKKELQVLVSAGNPLDLLNFVDAIERLGVGYLLEEEIDQVVQTFFDARYRVDGYDLYHTSIWFRILRQHGFRASSDVFCKFKDGNSRFKDSLASDVKGILALYEASHVSVHGDDILDEALVFTTAHLKDVTPNHPLASQVVHALYQPYHKGMTRLEFRYFITFYEQDPYHNKTLLKYAKLDFNRLQALHKKELRDLSWWWKDLDLNEKMQVQGRSRVPEGYFWLLGAYFEPQYALARKIFFKVFKLISIVDDVYDAYGTFDELTMFTKAIERWDRSCIDELPDYMKVVYEWLLDTFEEFERDLAPEGRSWCAKYARKEMIDNCIVYYQEAKWLHEKHTPTLDEYLDEAAIVSFGYDLLIVASYVGMGEVVTKEAFEWAAHSNAKVMRTAGLHARLMDDIGSYPFEQSRNHVPSAVQCYMRHHGVTDEATFKEFGKRVDKCWKDINEMMLMPYEMPKPVLTRIINLCRMVEVIYKGEDSYTFANHTMKNNITHIFTDPIPI